MDRCCPPAPGGKAGNSRHKPSVSLTLECLAGGMSLREIDDAFDSAFPHEALPEILRVASELADSFHVAA